MVDPIKDNALVCFLSLDLFLFAEMEFNLYSPFHLLFFNPTSKHGAEGKRCEIILDWAGNEISHCYC